MRNTAFTPLLSTLGFALCAAVQAGTVTFITSFTKDVTDTYRKEF